MTPASISRSSRFCAVPRDTCSLYSFFILFTIGITKGRWNTLISQLQRFKDAYDANLPLSQAMPGFAAGYPRYNGTGLRDLCQGIHDFYRAHDLARLTTDMYTSDLVPEMLPADAWAQMTRRNTDRVPIDDLEDRTTAVLLTPYPPGIPLLIPGERFNATIVGYLRFAEAFNQAYPGLETIIHGAETHTAGNAPRLYVNCLRPNGKASATPTLTPNSPPTSPSAHTS